MKIEQIYRQDDWWDKINFSHLERNVRRLQGRIYRVSKKGNKKGAHNLMKLLVRSESTKLLAIYTITQKNKGRITPGIDGKVYLTSKDRMELSKEKFDYNTYRFQPVLRRYIPKGSLNWRRVLQNRKRNSDNKTEKRPLGVMTVKDRIMTKIISYALTAKWEALLDAGVMGFRPGRNSQDALQAIYRELSKGERIILDADINKFFDTISHKTIMSKLDLFNGILLRCLKAGIVDAGKKQQTTKGIVQGSPVSPILANIALYGLQQELGTDGSVIVYADDFIVITKTKVAMKRVIPKLARFLKERGLNLKREKTRITNNREGFHFLGFTIEQPRQKLYIKPQKERVKRFLDYIRLIIWTNKQITQQELILKLNPIIRGWAQYYKYSDADKTFEQVDHAIWNLLWRWAKRRHPKKGKRWILHRYFGVVGEQSLSFQDKHYGLILIRAEEIKREKYKFIVKTMSPLDPDTKVKEYWKRRRYEKIRSAAS